ncbi:MAG: hypothetical protein P4L46_17445 [Fimbriimonas sp.]|nr:hypothetical protein [Fimbriimonas sp.]
MSPSLEAPTLKQIVGRLGVYYTLICLVTVGLHEVLRHAHFGTLLPMDACGSVVAVVRALVDWKAGEIWLVCAVSTLMLSAVAAVYATIGLSLSDGLNGIGGGALAIVIATWASVLLLREKHRQLGR